MAAFHNYGTSSNAKLNTCHDEIVLVMTEALKMTPPSIDITIVHGFRDKATQNGIDPRFTTKRWPASYHNAEDADGEPRSDACDFAPYITLRSGKKGIPWTDVKLFSYVAGIIQAAASRRSFFSSAWAGATAVIEEGAVTVNVETGNTPAIASGAVQVTNVNEAQGDYEVKFRNNPNVYTNPPSPTIPCYKTGGVGGSGGGVGLTMIVDTHPGPEAIGVKFVGEDIVAVMQDVESKLPTDVQLYQLRIYVRDIFGLWIQLEFNILGRQFTKKTPDFSQGELAQLWDAREVDV